MWKNRFSYLAFLAIMIYLSIMYQEYITTSLAFLFLIFPVPLWFWTYFAKRKVQVYMKSDTLVAGKSQVFHILLQFVNSSILPITRIHVEIRFQNCYIKSPQKADYYVALNARSTQEISCEMSSMYCGKLEVVLKNIYIYDYLGLWKFRIKQQQLIGISILPEFHEIPFFHINTEKETYLEQVEYASNKKGDDPSEIFRIREYMPGDKMNQIHWKLTAKEGMTMVKEFGFPLECSIVLLLELGQSKTRTDYIDSMIETACSISNKLLSMKMLHFIAWFDDKTQELKRICIDSEEILYDTLADLFEIQIGKENNALLTYQGCYPWEQYSNFFYFISEGREAEPDKIRSAAKQANCYCILVTEKENLTEKEKEGFHGEDINLFLIHPQYLKEDIEQLFLPEEEKAV